MTETMEPMASDVDKLELAQQLLAREQGVELMGPNGLLGQLTPPAPPPRGDRLDLRGRLRGVAPCPGRRGRREHAGGTRRMNNVMTTFH